MYSEIFDKPFKFKEHMENIVIFNKGNCLFAKTDKTLEQSFENSSKCSFFLLFFLFTHRKFVVDIFRIQQISTTYVSCSIYFNTFEYL